MHSSGYLLQSVMQRNLSQCIQPIGGVRARPFSKAELSLENINAKVRNLNRKFNIFLLIFFFFFKFEHFLLVSKIERLMNGNYEKHLQFIPKKINFFVLFSSKNIFFFFQIFNKLGKSLFTN